MDSCGWREDAYWVGQKRIRTQHAACEGGAFWTCRDFGGRAEIIKT
jgi:hypothetical protein